MSISYTATVQDPFGFNLMNVGRVEELRAARAVNSVGSATLILPDKYAPEYWRRDMRFRLYRKSGSARHLLGNTIWFARKFKQSWSGKFWEIGLQDACSILGRHIVAYKQETVFADKTFLNDADDCADNLMKQYLRENMWVFSLQDQNRNLGNHFYVEDNRNLGPVVEKTASYAEILSTLTGLVNDAAELGTKLYFDVFVEKNTIPNTIYPELLVFRVFKDHLGTNRSSGLTIAHFGPQFGNLTDIELEWNYEDEYTAVYAGGMGQGAARLVVSQKNDERIILSPFGRRETFIDVNDVDVESVLEDEARAKLYKHTPKVALNARVVDTPQLQFGRDYFYGDLVKASVGVLDFVPLIDAFSVNYAGGKEELDIRFRA